MRSPEHFFSYVLEEAQKQLGFETEDFNKHLKLIRIMRRLPKEERLQIFAIAELLERKRDRQLNEADTEALEHYKKLSKYLLK